MCLLLAEEVAEVGDCIFGVANKLGLGLSAMQLLTFDIG